MMWWALYLSFFVCLAKYWYPWCCCGDSPPCGTYCTSDADTVTVTIGGLSAGTDCVEASCNTLEGSYVLPRQVWDPCYWQKVWYRGCDPATWPISCGYLIKAWTGTIPLSSNWGWNVYIGFQYGNLCASSEAASYKWDSGAASKFDCTATQSLTNAAVSAGSGCSGWATATVQVN